MTMGLPKLTVKLFPPKPGKSYAASGNLTIPLSDVHAFAEWLLGQSGEYDDYLQQNVVRILAFEYHNRSRGGTNYRTVQLRDPADLNGNEPYQGSGNNAYGSSRLSPGIMNSNPDDGDDVPF
jgi:hypothetical protein